jgi:oxalate decarboxylase/phosphoglucose isomerase-like protein (cupin superfamily)
MFKAFAERGQEKMKEVLMSPEASGQEIHYYMIRGGDKKTNITVWECGTIGKPADAKSSGEAKEYIKTYGHYHVGNISETYTVLQGTGILLLQKRKIDADGKPIDDEIESFQALTVKAGDKIFIHPEMGHLMVNTGNIWLVTSDDSPVYPDDVDPVGMPGHADYEPIKKMGGFAYFVVEKDGEPTLVKNPKYKTVPKTEIIQF